MKNVDVCSGCMEARRGLEVLCHSLPIPLDLFLNWELVVFREPPFTACLSGGAAGACETMSGLLHGAGVGTLVLKIVK